MPARSQMKTTRVPSGDHMRIGRVTDVDEVIDGEAAGLRGGRTGVGGASCDSDEGGEPERAFHGPLLKAQYTAGRPAEDCTTLDRSA